jgi:hypothetical protein
MKASKFDKKFITQSSVGSRKENIREEKVIKGELPKVVFSFKDFDKDQIPPGQTYEDWQKRLLGIPAG